MDASTPHEHALRACVSSLQSSMQRLESSINVLDAGVDDFPRLGKVLQTTRHFELVSEHHLLTAQSSLLSEIQPEVSNLLSRVETYLDKLQRREKSLIAKAELREGRLHPPSRASQGAKSPRMKGGAGGLDKLEELKYHQLKQKKERLSYAVERLELQANQRQRQLRKSMAFQ